MATIFCDMIMVATTLYGSYNIPQLQVGRPPLSHMHRRVGSPDTSYCHDKNWRILFNLVPWI